MTHRVPPYSGKKSRGRTKPAKPSLHDELVRLVSAAPNDAPLPTTRELGQRFAVANTTVFRIFEKLVQGGKVWQHPGGRYYPAAARATLHRLKPVACLTRRLELCSQLYRELLEGISSGCGLHQRTMLLWHDDLLVNHPDVTREPVFATPGQQRAILRRFLDRHGETAGGFVLDHVWHDDVIGEFADRLLPGVIMFRVCGIMSVSNIKADFRAGILMALTHLLARSYDRILPIEPFASDPAVEEFLSILSTAGEDLGCRDRILPTAGAGTSEQRARLIHRLQESKGRTALLVPEDNIARTLLENIKTAGIACPEKIGLLSGMGTDFAVKAGLSCLRYDFRALGRRAIEALSAKPPAHEALAPQFFAGSTT